MEQLLVGRQHHTAAPDLSTVAAPTELIAALGLLVAHRADLIDEWVRGVSLCPSQP